MQHVMQYVVKGHYSLFDEFAKVDYRIVAQNVLSMLHFLK